VGFRLTSGTAAYASRAEAIRDTRTGFSRRAAIAALEPARASVWINQR
jgi:hypothetical protein